MGIVAVASVSHGQSGGHSAGWNLHTAKSLNPALRPLSQGHAKSSEKVDFLANEVRRVERRLVDNQLATDRYLSVFEEGSFDASLIACRLDMLNREKRELEILSAELQREVAKSSLEVPRHDVLSDALPEISSCLRSGNTPGGRPFLRLAIANLDWFRIAFRMPLSASFRAA